MIKATSAAAISLSASLACAAPLPESASNARITPAQAEALVRQISAAVEDIRGLKFKTPVAMQVVDGATAREQFKAKFVPWSEQEARHTQDAYVQLGLVPRGTQLMTRFLDFAEKDVAGYYEHGTKTFYLLDHVAPDEVRTVMAHELTHALEDQTYDIGSVYKKANPDGDRATAIAAVVEGSAMAVMLAFMSREMGGKKASEKLEKDESKRAARLRVAPSFTQRSLLLPYLLGFTFLLRGKPWEFYLGGGVKTTDLDHCYASPPFSTREILHPEQYWVARQRNPPQRLTLPDLSSILGGGWSKATEGSIGELGLTVLTGSQRDIEMPWALLPTRWTTAAATGTVGDAYHHYVNGDRAVTVLLTRWETDHDAEQFDHALLNKGKYFFRYGVNVLVIAGDVGDKAEAAAVAALQGAKFGPTQ
jgi:hypothetical protein